VALIVVVINEGFATTFIFIFQATQQRTHTATSEA
jgi:hypothetical protein